MEDVTGYDRHERKRAAAMATGFAVIVMGFSLSQFFRLLPNVASGDAQIIAEGLDKLMRLVTKDLVDASFSQAHILASLVLMVCAVLGIVILNAAILSFLVGQAAVRKAKDEYESPATGPTEQ